MTLSDVRALGKGVVIDRHGHKLSGASKVTYLVYLSNKTLNDLNPVLVAQGKEFVTQYLSKIA